MVTTSDVFFGFLLMGVLVGGGASAWSVDSSDYVQYEIAVEGKPVSEEVAERGRVVYQSEMTAREYNFIVERAMGKRTAIVDYPSEDRQREVRTVKSVYRLVSGAGYVQIDGSFYEVQADKVTAEAGGAVAEAAVTFERIVAFVTGGFVGGLITFGVVGTLAVFLGSVES